MSTSGNELIAEFNEMADTPAPASRVDVAEAIRQGRSRLHRRRLSALSAVAVVSASAVVLTVALPGSNDPARPANRSEATRPAAVPAVSDGSFTIPLRPATRQDPLTTDVSFGWLPKDFTNGVRYTSPSPRGQEIGAFGGFDDNKTGEITASWNDDAMNQRIVWLTLYPAGKTPPPGPTRDTDYKITAAPIDGRNAYWSSSSPDSVQGSAGQRILNWKTADGRWAEIQSANMNDADQTDILHRIAEGVKIGHWAVPLPYRSTGLPGKLESMFVQGGFMNPNGVPWEARSVYDVGGEAIETTVTPDVPSPSTAPTSISLSKKQQERLNSLPKQEREKLEALSISAQEGILSMSSVGISNMLNSIDSVKGGPKKIAPPLHQVALTCVSANGLKACTSAAYGDTKAYDTVGGPKQWLSKFTLLGTAPSDWTTDVIH